MDRTLSNDLTAPLMARLGQATARMTARYPGDASRRQPVHTVYGGAHLFRADLTRKLGAAALRALEQYAPDFVEFARVIVLPGAEKLPRARTALSQIRARMRLDGAAVKRKDRPAWLAHTVYGRVIDKLRAEPVEDFRIDFEDGYGNRPDPEEDGHAAGAAREVARGLAEDSLPPFIGIRIKPFTDELRDRAVRTLDLFVSTLVRETRGRLPGTFVVTLPKVTCPEQVSVLADLLDLLEKRLGLAAGALPIELMIETPPAIINDRGGSAVRGLVDAARGRAVAAHFGTYDYTAACHITAAHQKMTHPACDFARHVMQVSLAGTGIWMSDGATNILPIAPHRAPDGGPALSPSQASANRAAVQAAWRLHYHHVQHSLVRGLYQGWDLHPAQLPTRYAAVYAFFLDGLDEAAARLRHFVSTAAQATLAGGTFDDAATGQGLLTYFLRALNCGAITEAEALETTGLTVDELRSRSFARILQLKNAR